MTVFVVGDSVGVGIAGAIAGSRNLSAERHRIPQMETHFRTAIDAAGQGDTVIISAGYNSITGDGGIPQAELAQLQGWINELHAKGARVVIPALRTEGMQGNYARLNGTPAQTANRQLAALQNITFADECRTVGGRAADGLHGGYNDIARICQAAAAAARDSTGDRNAGNGNGTEETTNGNGGQPEPEADPNESSSAKMRRWANQIKESMPGFFGNLLGGLLEMLAGLIEGIGGMFSGSGDSSRTLTQEITDVTNALGVRGQSGALQDNTLSADEKNRLKIEVQQVQAALPSTMTDEVRQSVTGMLSALQAGGVEDTDDVLGSAMTGLRNAIQPARQ